jgi:hypothetical protein
MIIPREPQIWLEWFDRFQNKEAIRLAAYHAGELIHDLHELTPESAALRLEQVWSKVFVPSPQHVDILSNLLDQARTFAIASFPTIKDYNRLRYDLQSATHVKQPIRCLTGLAGVSKSSLVQAFERICRLQFDGEFITETQRIRIYPVRREVIDGHQAVRGVLKSLANPLAINGSNGQQIDVLMAHVSDWLMATATSLLIVDEMQFFTQSNTANTRTSQLILSLANLRPPLLFVANYSLVRKLMQRPHEEKDRLLSSPIILNPPGRGDACWVDVIKEYFAVSPGTFQFDPVEYADLLHQYTAGLFRALKRLLILAYGIARTNGIHVVTVDDVKAAYRSREYCSYRRDVEDVISLGISNFLEERRPDLLCPFSEIPFETHFKSTNIPSIESALREMPAALLESALSPAARATVRELRKAANQTEDQRIEATITPLPKRQSVSAQTLHAGAQLLREGTFNSSGKSTRGKGNHE